MAAHWTSIQSAFLQSLSVFHTACGGTKGGVCILYVMMAADIATGVLRARMGKSDKSPSGRPSPAAAGRGLMLKLLMLLVVFLSSLLDSFTGLQGVLRGTVIWFYVGNEGLSVLENLMHLGVPVPKRLKALLVSGSREE